MNGQLRLPVLIAAVALVSTSVAFAQGTKPAPKTAKPPAKTAPAPKKPAAPATAAAIPPPPPPPSDVRYKTTYVNADQTTDSVTFIRDTRERYELEELKIDVIPMAATPPAALNALATELSVDYLLIGELTDLKASKPGGLTKIMKNTAGEGSGKDITEAKLNVQFLPPGGKPRLTKTTSGKDGGVGFKTGLGLAKLAGSLYLKM